MSEFHEIHFLHVQVPPSPPGGTLEFKSPRGDLVGLASGFRISTEFGVKQLMVDLFLDVPKVEMMLIELINRCY